LKIAVLGSTGSIGTQTLDVARNLNIEVIALTAFSNIDLLEAQIAEFKPHLVVVCDETAASELKKRLKHSEHSVEVIAGFGGLQHAAAMPQADIVVNALVGSVGLFPTIAAIQAGKDVALANKEVLVCAGEVIMPLAKERGVQIIPVDSEHSAIFQCLSAAANPPHRIYLTASGGPFLNHTAEQLERVTIADALNHPNWAMGRKISVDSATMMNKGLEVIEARWLFDLDASRISVLVHPQSIIHSMVEFADGQILAQMGAPDMRLPIQHALTFPKRLHNSFSRLDFSKHSTLTFQQPDMAHFGCLRLAYDALAAGGMFPAVLNAANEVAVQAFLDGKIAFNRIQAIIEGTISAYTDNTAISIEYIPIVEKWARNRAESLIKKEG